jgi:hypothetical protein
MHAACPDVQGTEHIAPIHAAAARAVLDVAETVAMRQRRCMRGNASVAMHARRCMRRNAWRQCMRSVGILTDGFAAKDLRRLATR